MSSLPFSLGRSVGEAGQSLAQKYKMWQDRIRGGVADVQDAYSEGSAFGVPIKPVFEAADSFGAGVRGEAIPGQDIELPQSRTSLMEPEVPLAIAQHLGEKPAVGTDGIPEALRRPTGMNYPEPVAEPAGRVNVTINGKTYDYSGGKNGGAPLAGGQLGSLFGKPWTNEATDQTHEFAGEGNGSYSQMTENPAMKSLGQLKDEQALADARPAGDPDMAGLGYTRGEARGLDYELERRRAQESDRVGAELRIAEGKAGIQDQQQGRRRDDYAGAVQAAEAKYNAYIADLEAQPNLSLEEKERLKGEAAARHATITQGIKDSFGVGLGMAGIVARPEV